MLGPNRIIFEANSLSVLYRDLKLLFLPSYMIEECWVILYCVCGAPNSVFNYIYDVSNFNMDKKWNTVQIRAVNPPRPLSQRYNGVKITNDGFKCNFANENCQLWYFVHCGPFLGMRLILDQHCLDHDLAPNRRKAMTYITDDLSSATQIFDTKGEEPMSVSHQEV